MTSRSVRKAKRVEWREIRKAQKSNEPNYDQWWLNPKPLSPQERALKEWKSRRRKQGIAFLVIWLTITLIALIGLR